MTCRGQTLAYPGRQCCPHLQMSCVSSSTGPAENTMLLMPSRTLHQRLRNGRGAGTLPSMVTNQQMCAIRLNGPISRTNPGSETYRIRSAASKHFWLTNSRSKLSLSNKVTICKQIIPQIWRYGCQIWGLAYDSQIRRT